ncbi:MAG: twitching motility protein PilT [Bacteroidetes bacterium]|nr:twitching motility protein PilT [Rhodothermaceae bacterium RA]RMH64974.1 MAG: twitching motility protein PilT [Bacteroidota bacterium]
MPPSTLIDRLPPGTPALPASYYTLLPELPPEYEGEDRLRFLAERVNTLPRADREAVHDLFRAIVRQMIVLGASDMDLGGPASNGQVWYRIDGFKRPHERAGRFTTDETDLLLLSLLSPMQQDYFFRRRAIDFGYSLPSPTGGPDRRFRTTVYYDLRHLALSMRMLAWEPRSLQSLGFHPTIERGLLFRYVRDGLTLVTGVTGSGKSTTLDAIVDANNRDIEAHVLIIAQPIEYIHTSRKCIIRHREVGTDVESYITGMIQGLRQDPDIVVVGEMRDADSITTAMETADTGHKVFSTLHTGSATETINRIVAEYPPFEQERIRFRLAEVLRCVISQKLVPAINGGRVLAKEVLWMTPPAQAAIRNGNTREIYQMIWQGWDDGMITMEQDLARLVRQGDITPDVALSHANNKRRLLRLLA